MAAACGAAWNRIPRRPEPAYRCDRNVEGAGVNPHVHQDAGGITDQGHRRPSKVPEERGEFPPFFLPDHQGGDITEGQECTTGVGGNNDVYTANADAALDILASTTAG